jgi:hypothetical protein
LGRQNIQLSKKNPDMELVNLDEHPKEQYSFIKEGDHDAF